MDQKVHVYHLNTNTKKNYLYEAPGVKPVSVKILFPSKMIAFSQFFEAEFRSSTYFRFPPVISGNWTWIVVGVICKNWMFSSTSFSCSCSSFSPNVAQTTTTQHSFLCSGAGFSMHKGSPARKPWKWEIDWKLIDYWSAFWIHFQRRGAHEFVSILGQLHFILMDFWN